MVGNGEAVDRRVIHDELERARTDLHQLVERATTADLSRPTDGTRWTNQQMLWHMAFGYLVTSRLLRLVRLFGKLPEPWSRAFAAVLDSGTRPFHHVNYLGAVGGAMVFHGPRLTRQLDHTIDHLHRTLDAESEAALARRMHFPVGWDPFFRDTMTLAEVYRYATQHYDFHRGPAHVGLTTDGVTVRGLTSWLITDVPAARSCSRRTASCSGRGG